ncbi:Cytochrome b5 isoform [Vigna angularis]|uniref:Cytochrome b5 isoform n=1 Tax=Phaseolus angularis TaxID=3914 RepID=A0A8T0JPT2_PHAAN|nr:Cytochrome b5 isoform [Vigna angularis]
MVGVISDSHFSLFRSLINSLLWLYNHNVICLVAIWSSNGAYYVYDVTQYLDDHPGGDDVILAATGKDATEDFEDAGHSKSARELMEQYCIGELDPSPPVSTKHSYSEKFMQLTKQYWAVPVTFVGISVVVGFLYLRKK